MGTTQERARERFHFLDGLRAIASVLVLLHHSVTSGVASFIEKHGFPFIANLVKYSTQSGVMLFFVLSGVVLLRPYLRGDRKFETLDYFWRRAKRIYPPFFVALLFGWLVVVYIQYGPHTYYKDTNLFKWGYDISIWELLREAPIVNYRGGYYNLAWWSLQVEVMFYILVPLFLVFFSFRKQLSYPHFFAVVVLTLVCSYVIQQVSTAYIPEIYTVNKDHPWYRLNMFRFLDTPISFIMGVYLAKYDFKKIIGYVLFFGGAIIVIAARTYEPFINSGYGVLYGGLIILIFNSKRLQRLLDNPFMVWLGERSYSLFLIHFSVFYFVNYTCSLILPERNMWYGICTRAIGIPLAFFLAMLLFHFVERRQARGLVTGHIFWPWQLKKLYPKK